MARFDGEHHATLTVRHPVDRVREHFADLDQVVAHSADVESAERPDPRTVRFELEEQHHGFARFKGRYTCRWQLDDDGVLTWETLEEGEPNMGATGRASFRAVPGGTEVDYREAVHIDLDLPRPMAAALRPVVSKVLALEVEKYVKRMVRALG